MWQKGDHILASPSLQGDYFEGADILLVTHDASGSIGFITNRSCPKKLNDLAEFSHCPPIPLFEGGPMGQDHLYLTHQRPDLISGGSLVSAGTYWGGSMDDLVQALANETIGHHQFTLFIGYCGWDNGELDAEHKEGSWLTAAH